MYTVFYNLHFPISDAYKHFSVSVNKISHHCSGCKYFSEWRCHKYLVNLYEHLGFPPNLKVKDNFWENLSLETSFLSEKHKYAIKELILNHKS